MALDIESATALFDEGQFAKLVSESGASATHRDLPPLHRAILAHALAQTGDHGPAERLALIEAAAGSGAGRWHAELALGLLDSRTGNFTSAEKHIRTAMRFAKECDSPERIAWAQVSLFRLFIDCASRDNALASLVEARRTVARAGNPRLTSYLHICVSVLEGQAGNLDEAERHCRIADSLLEQAPNAWLRACTLLDRGCVAYLRCDFSKATAYFLAAKEAAVESGHTYLRLAAETNLGQIDLMTGKFESARQKLLAVSTDAAITPSGKLGAVEALARLHLALGEFDRCEQLLADVGEHIRRNEQTRFVYPARWAVITRARLQIKQGRPDDALETLAAAEMDTFRLRDRPFDAAAELVAAEALASSGRQADAGHRLFRAAQLGISRMRELQPQYDYASAFVLREAATPLKGLLKDRALGLWAAQGNQSVPLEMPVTPQGLDADADGFDADCLTNALAAIGDVVYRPRVLATQVLAVLNALRCSPDVKVLATRLQSEGPRTSRAVAVLPLGIEGRKKLFLACRTPEDPRHGILLNDVLRITQAALQLQRYREEERHRAAVWPEAAIEEQAGALFLADETKQLLATARRIAATTVPVLITGETGTGKEVLARVIHAYSPRARAPFLPFNCSGVPRDMLDSQLFGHRRGAFTGAIDHFPGVIRSAAGGTLLLDEIGETTLDVQPKLLRFLESGEVHPIGETQPTRSDVRVIAATNADLDALVAQGRFREDLFYRLNIVRLHLPPLRERRVEIPALANHYLQKHAQEYRKGELRLAEETMEYLVLYRWPGNVRQLANEMRRLAALAEAGAVLMPEHLSPEIAASRRTIPASERVLEPTELVVRIDQPMAAATQHVERAMIQYALQKCGGRMEDTAALLGLSRKGLYLKRVRYGLEPPDAAPAEVA